MRFLIHAARRAPTAWKAAVVQHGTTQLKKRAVMALSNTIVLRRSSRPSPMACDCAACARFGELRHVHSKEIVRLTIAVKAAVVISIQAQQVVELVSGESASTFPLEMAVLNGR